MPWKRENLYHSHWTMHPLPKGDLLGKKNVSYYILLIVFQKYT